MPTIYKHKKCKRPNVIDLKRKERQKIYQDVRWQRLRVAYLADHPLCEECLAHGVTREAVDVHHVVSFMTAEGVERIELALNYDNLKALCKECHQALHNKR